MNGKEFMDQRFGQPRGNGNGIASILDEFAEIKIKEENKEILEISNKILKRSNVPIVKELAKEIIKKCESNE